MICLSSSLLYFPLTRWDSIYSHPILFPLSQCIMHFVPSSLRCPKVRFVRELFPFCFLKAIWLKQVSKPCPCPGSGDQARTLLLASQFSLPVSPLKCFSLPELFWVRALCFINMDMFTWELEKEISEWILSFETMQWFWLFVVDFPRVRMRWFCWGTDPLGFSSAGWGNMFRLVKYQQSVFRCCCWSNLHCWERVIWVLTHSKHGNRDKVRDAVCLPGSWGSC